MSSASPTVTNAAQTPMVSQDRLTLAWARDPAKHHFLWRKWLVRIRRVVSVALWRSGMRCSRFGGVRPEQISDQRVLATFVDDEGALLVAVFRQLGDDDYGGSADWFAAGEAGCPDSVLSRFHSCTGCSCWMILQLRRTCPNSCAGAAERPFGAGMRKVLLWPWRVS